MPAGIARRRIAQHRITKRSIGAQYSVENEQTPYQFPPGSYTFTVPKSGYWKFVGWGAGGAGTVGLSGGSGAYVEITKALRAGQTVALVVGLPSAPNTTMTFPDGALATAGGAALDAAGVASGGDVNLSGGAGAASGTGVAGAGSGGGAGGADVAGAAGGAGAPGELPFRGGSGGTGSSGTDAAAGRSPGGGASESNAFPSGGHGQIIAFLVRE